MTRNKDIRTELVSADVKLWEIAEKLGTVDSSFSRKLRRELTDQEKDKIRSAILEVKSDHRKEQN